MKNYCLLTLGLFLQTQIAFPQSLVSYTTISLHGKAEGGVLTFSDSINPYPVSVSINTDKGEAAESVAQRLSGAIRDRWSGFGWSEKSALAENGTIKNIPGGAYNLSGTEVGLGIPDPPTGISALYSKSTDQLTIRWINPETYDNITVCRDSFSVVLSGDSESYTVPKFSTTKKGASFFTVVGIVNQTPSAPATISASKDMMWENLGFHGKGRGESNWISFITSEYPDSKRNVERDAKARLRATSVLRTRPQEDDKTQVLRPGESGMLYRPIVGLEPNTTYSVSLKLSASDPNLNVMSEIMECKSIHNFALKSNFQEKVSRMKSSLTETEKLSENQRLKFERRINMFIPEGACGIEIGVSFQRLQKQVEIDWLEVKPL